MSGLRPAPNQGHLALLCPELWLILEHNLLTLTLTLTLGAGLEQGVITALRVWSLISSHPYFLPLGSTLPKLEHLERASSSLE